MKSVAGPSGKEFRAPGRDKKQPPSARRSAAANRDASNLLSAIVIAIGLPALLYAVFQVADAPLNVQWVWLGVVTILVVSLLDLHAPRALGALAISDTFIFAALFLFGVYPATVLASLDSGLCALRHRDRRKLAPFNAAATGLSIFVAGTVARQAVGDFASSAGTGILRLATLGLIAASIHYLLSAGLAGAQKTLSLTSDRLKAWQHHMFLSSISYFAGAAAACLVVKLTGIVGFYPFIIAVPILASLYLIYRSYADKVEASIEHAEEVADLHLRTIEALAIAIDAKDEVSHDHVRRVEIYAIGLARLFGLSEPEVEALKAAALLHDIGKLAVPDYISNKPGPLTPAEFDRMKAHAVVGAEILERVGFPYPVVPVVRHHHERWDGNGYPDGLRGDQIPVTARLLTVSDCFDSLREHRKYRPAKTREEAILMLREEAGKTFDPEVVRVFLEHLPEFEAEIRWQRVDVQPAPAPQPAARSECDIDPRTQGTDPLKRAHQEVIALYDIAKTIGGNLDLRDMFAVFSSRLQDIVSYTTCLLFLVKPDTTDIEVVHASGRNAEKLRGKKLPAGAGVTGWVVAHRQPMYNCDPRGDLDALKVDLPDQYLTATAAPLQKEGEIFGALTLYNAEITAYEPEHLKLVEAVAKLASDALGGSIRPDAADPRGLSDPVTGLPNARALRHRFDEEADRARKHRDDFAIVMIDIDGFKKVNEQMGHQAGDVVLRELGRFLASRLRSSDFVSRYAGDEFVAILQVGPDEAGELVQRIQANVERKEFRLPGASILIGLSAGWSSFGHDGQTLDELLVAADRAMYADKARRKAASGPGAAGSQLLNQFRVM